jgi:5-methylcytosine-specific restriction endonuclease McrA
MSESLWKRPPGPTAKRRRAKRAKKLRALAKVYEDVDHRDRYRCRVCGSRMNLSHHHIRERSLGGPDETWNLVLLCHDDHEAAQRHRLGESGDGEP